VDLRARGAWVAAVAAAAGTALTLRVLVRGGGYGVVVPRLTWYLPLAVIGAVALLAALGFGGARITPVVWLGTVVMAAIAWNFLVFFFRMGFGAFSGVLMSLPPTRGVDFRDGLYLPGRAFSNAGSAWPPLTIWIGKAFGVFSLHTGYVLQIVILVCLALSTAVFSARLAQRMSVGDGLGSGASAGRELVFVMGLWMLTSFGFAFAVERGQIDLYALAFALLAVWLLLREPMSPWWPALALAASVNLKVYPAVLAVLVLWRYRWKALVPLLVTNAALLLVAGPTNLQRFVAGQDALQGRGSGGWWGNMSALSTAEVLRSAGGAWATWFGYALLALSAGVWGVTMIALLRRGWSPRRAVIAAAACVPVMCTVTPLSNDYKLVWTVLPLAVAAVLVAELWPRRHALWTVLFIALAWETLFLARSSFTVHPSLQMSKFTLLLGLQFLLLALVALGESRRAVDSSGPVARQQGGRDLEEGPAAARQDTPTEAPT